jgi:hypothetical protein
MNDGPSAGLALALVGSRPIALPHNTMIADPTIPLRDRDLWLGSESARCAARMRTP